MRRLACMALLLIACSSKDGGDGSGDGDGDGSGDGDGDGGDGGDGDGGELTLPPVDAPIDYQLGGAYEPPDGVEIVSRDRGAAPASGLYNLCYVNGFQIQPDEESF